MKKFKLGHAVIAVAALALVGGPVTAAVWSAAAQDAPPAAVSAAELTVQLKAAVTQTTASLAGRTVSDAEAQAAYATALEGVIIASGAAPQTAADALVAAQSELRASGALSAAADAAITQLLARIRAEVDNAPAATGAENGLPAFGAPPVSGAGGGGPDYSSAA
jgi:hypothetical protein